SFIRWDVKCQFVVNLQHTLPIGWRLKSNHQTKPPAEFAEVARIGLAIVVEIENRRPTEAENAAERCEVHGIDRAIPVRVAEEAEQSVGRSADFFIIIANRAVAVAVEVYDHGCKCGQGVAAVGK